MMGVHTFFFHPEILGSIGWVKWETLHRRLIHGSIIGYNMLAFGMDLADDLDEKSVRSIDFGAADVACFVQKLRQTSRHRRNAGTPRNFTRWTVSEAQAYMKYDPEETPVNSGGIEAS
jgi:hypothetical protein